MILPFCRALTRLVFVVAALALVTAGASADEAPLRTETLEIASDGTVNQFTVEVAETDRQRAKGLMFRETMAADHGMLFIFEGEGERYFWMKNTPLPLDIIYISRAGAIVSIAADTTPYSEKVIPSNGAAKYVLELNAGTAQKLGISAGDTVSSPSMAGE